MNKPKVKAVVDLDNPPEGYYTSGKYRDEDPYLMKELTSNIDREPNYVEVPINHPDNYAHSLRSPINWPK